MSDLDRLGKLVRQFEWQIAGERLRKYKPYPWQMEFHAAGKDNPERMLMAANRVGKTISAGCEISYHLTGDYPAWWDGKRFDGPTLVWTGSPTNETSRDILQVELLGGLGEKLGTGWVPRRFLHGHPQTRQAGVKNVVDGFAVRHKSGGLSNCQLKTYEMGWQKWQGTAPHVVWLDEEPNDYMIYSESQTRILTSRGIILVTFTPLLGVTDLVQHFQEGGPGIYLKGASWGDAPHLSQDDKERLRLSYRSHERKARTEGIPMMGEGAVFPIDDEEIAVPAFKVPDHWTRGKGCDFGINHPAAGVECAHDRDQDIIYLIDCYRKDGQTAPYHAAWFNKSNRDLPVAWPHDGMNREKSGGRTLADAYREHGVNMMSKSARYPKVPGDVEKGGAQPVEPIVDEMLTRMMTGRFKAFAHLSEFFEEKRSYHRKDNVIIARRDDILKALFYAVMMRRYWMPLSQLRTPHRSSAPQHPIASTHI